MKYEKQMACLLIALLGMAAGVQAQQDTLKVLFVGNSYTYFWNMPQTLQAMSVLGEGKTFIMARQSTEGGTNWKQHWNGEKGLESKRLIQDGDWDVVVLQNHSKSPTSHPERFMEYGEKLIKLVKEQGAKPVLYMTWAREYNPLMQEAISSKYRQLGKNHGVEVVPVGEVWASIRQLRPELNLFDPDGSHPSTIGTYLTACTFFSFFSSQSCGVLPKRITTTDINGEEFYLSIMSEENAEFMQDAVDRFMREVPNE